jgi:UDP-N-acetylmuramyl pentapeptide phosphotransferase/UDP-N-acetylglucosamine-1-phosphate transferase
VTSVHAPLTILMAGLGAVFAAALIPLALARAPQRLHRTNVSGRKVPAVLGIAVVIAGATTSLTVAALDYAHWDAASAERVTLSVLLLVVVAGGGGLLDDLRGNEASQGFRGHLAAAAQGRLTGGLIKVVLVGVAGLGAGLLAGSGFRFVVECAAAVALSANLVNLLDRAPGRAAKVSLVAAVPLVILAPGAWSVAAAGTLGATATSLPFDLAERGMLGDAGSNAIGAVLGLGLALAASEVALVVALVMLAVLNLASERWSFSEVIERNKPLALLDSWGRRRQNNAK